MLLDINRLENIKIDIRHLNKNERIQLLYSLKYLGLFKTYSSFQGIDECSYTFSSVGFWFVYVKGKRNLTIQDTGDLDYFKEHQNTEVKAEDILIKDLIDAVITTVPTGMFIRLADNNFYIKTQEGILCKTDSNYYALYKELHFISTRVLYSKSLNHMMLSKVFEGEF